MIDAAEKAREFVTGRQRSDLDTDDMLLWALVRAVEVVGEAASKVSDEGRQELPNVQWQKIVGMRNRLVHAYFDINRNILWRTVTEELPDLEQALRAVV